MKAIPTAAETAGRPYFHALGGRHACRFERLTIAAKADWPRWAKVAYLLGWADNRPLTEYHLARPLEVAPVLPEVPACT